jgi:hypothetical protein
MGVQDRLYAHSANGGSCGGASLAR